MALAMGLCNTFKELIPLAEQVMDQTTRRVIYGEKVPAEEKVVSIFEPHTDIIKPAAGQAGRTAERPSMGTRSV